MVSSRLSGLIAATYTPFHADGTLALSKVAPMVEHLIRAGNRGLYVCGSTGEGVSLTTLERCQVAEAYAQAANKRVPVIVQVGHNCIAEAKHLAAHAEEIGADAVSATCPSYFKVVDIVSLFEVVQAIASAAPRLPFYYYHIPAVTGSQVDIVSFLQFADGKIPNFAGIKYTDKNLAEFQRCLSLGGGKFDAVWGCDDMLLGAIATGARAAIGSTFNVLAPLYLEMIRDFESNRLAEAQQIQLQSIEFICKLGMYPFHTSMKELLRLLGHDFGTCRSPQRSLSKSESKTLHQGLQHLKCLFALDFAQSKLRTTPQPFLNNGP
ncbi:N-acetylneuraminate lyase [Bremerella volcania]|uniref:N-acetylneuraminate lyase n=1 Tax=Bremerella volcania TaxID=2527984 RepID=A0A518C9H6_9BACT|nr:dihydrodipicolinate synthase family protein [Bremerella volcania]QDU75875.1 N-acetylneuraminate lyase [Bremerella volcania]